MEVMPDGHTVLHLYVIYNHLEALKVLVESEVAYENCPFLNSKESADGKTNLHLALMLKQIEVSIREAYYFILGKIIILYLIIFIWNLFYLF